MIINHSSKKKPAVLAGWVNFLTYSWLNSTCPPVQKPPVGQEAKEKAEIKIHAQPRVKNFRGQTPRGRNL
jgi:hypothetical protein